MNKLPTGIAVVALLLAVVAVFSGGDTTETRTIVDRIVGANPGTDFSNEVDFSGGAVIGNPVTASTTSGTAGTLTERQLLNRIYTRIEIGATTEGADYTLTFPASTSLASFIRTPGDMTTRCFMLTGTTSESQLIFAAGTGIDFRVASSSVTGQTITPALLNIAGAETCFRLIRQPDDGGGSGDITALIEVLDDAD